MASSVESKPRALLVSEVAELLSIAGRQVYKLAAEHRIPYLRIAGSIRFDPLVLAKWLQQRVACVGCDKCEQRTLGEGVERSDAGSRGAWSNDATGHSYDDE